MGRMNAAIPLEDILEKDWARQVRDLARTLGWEAYHTYDSRRSDTGFPDEVLVRENDRILFLELKRERTKVTDWQAHWIRLLHSTGEEVYVVRPRNLQALALVLQHKRGTVRWHEGRGELLLELDPILEVAA